MAKKKKIEKQNGDIAKFSESEFYFDDCAICQGVKSAEETGRSLGSDDLRKLFKKANKNSKNLKS